MELVSHGWQIIEVKKNSDLKPTRPPGARTRRKFLIFLYSYLGPRTEVDKNIFRCIPMQQFRRREVN